MSEFGKKPFGQWQQPPTGFDTFGSNIHNSNHPVSSLGPRLSSSAPTFPPTTTGIGWLEHHSNTPGLTAFSDPGRSNVTNHSGPTGNEPKYSRVWLKSLDKIQDPNHFRFGAPSQSFGGWAWGGPATDTSKQPFSPFVESELGNRQKSSYQNLCFQGPYKNSSQEELRLPDYALGHRYGLSSGFGGPSFGTGFGTSMQRSASGPPQTLGMGSQQGAFGTGFGAKPSGAAGFGSVTTTTSPFGQAKAGKTFVWGQKSQGPNVFGTQPDGFQRPTSSQRDFGVSGSPGFGFSQRPWYGSAPQESRPSWSSPSILQSQSQQQAQASTSFTEAQKPSSSQPPTGSIFRTDLSTASNPFASAATQVSGLSGPSNTSQKLGLLREMPVGRVQVPQSFGQQTQYGQTGTPYYQVPGRLSSGTRLIQQPLQGATRATIQPQLVAKIDELTAYGAPWLFLTTEEKQQ
ncbi:hypothetical protein FOPG_18124 [Fusarium oxysporum f. sp. conglutinans race 2 54008]|uniref:Nucleoporin NUP145 n=1 Tax=Fusarium oxysporum f. sp. conglutinans race 2 54008 TaxID=1089457 RepID=X0GPU2_FUSOX|nr:hypothetical protein FOPG_18124 [Fusarium oxysporum f. sp. conglutinans race 2 54008]KAG6989423.1 hypothetical protein FocnCong_v021010 [Fusarium oxysporum f. sp. conglutinans]KAI8404284.1 hypothetical protein FOFC_15779 [Fusarium oxysporum]